MKSNNNTLIMSLGKQAEILNTLNGGVSQTHINFKENDSHFVIIATNNSLRKDAFQVKVINNQLVIFTLINIGTKDDQEVVVPSFAKAFPIPFFVNIEDIDARYEERALKVILPFNNKVGGYLKDIDIKEA